MKVVTLVGTRPEAIKMAPVIKELQSRHEIESVVCSTGQHKEMLKQAFADFKIHPDYNLDVMQENQTLGGLAGQIFEKFDSILAHEKPDWLLVQGDTNSVAIGALCAFYRKIKVGHIEAGLRSYNKWSPFPEEVNRKVAGVVADLHFSPTKRSKENLLKENVSSESIFVTGNTVVDALQWMAREVRNMPPQLPDRVENAYRNGKKIVLITGHRRESFGKGLRSICEAIKQLANKYEEMLFVYPVHLNPNVQELVGDVLGNHERIALIPPLSYKPFVRLMDISSFIVTDSGGIQEEGPALGKPVFVTRDVTERPEGIAAGTTKLVGTDCTTIVRELCLAIEDEHIRQAMSQSVNPYGDGNAAKRIADAIISEQKR